jgi:beta-glucosidase
MNPRTSEKNDARVEALVQQMTLEEKIGQMVCRDARDKNLEDDIRAGRVGTVVILKDPRQVNRLQEVALRKSRLGIPLFIGNDVIHGFRTIFPIPLAEACSWDLDLIERTAAIAGQEALAAGTQWIHGPMVDITRDPRWGRIAEGAGEDPFLGAAVARARVEGFQRVGSDGTRAFACAKHYVAYGAAEGGRDYNTAEVSEATLKDVYLPPFAAAVKAHVETVMTSYSDVNGIPLTVNRRLIRDVLRTRLGFEGLVITDYDAMAELAVHGVASSAREACAKSFCAGIQMDNHSGIYAAQLPGLVRSGVVQEQEIDAIVAHILRLKYAIGLFNHALVDSAKCDSTLLKKEFTDVALEAACRSMVLLRNRDGILPLQEARGPIALIGPLVDDTRAPLGCWCCDGRPADVVTILDAMRRRAEVRYEKGCEIDGDCRDRIPEAVNIARQSAVAILVLGESAGMSGEARCRSSLGLPGVQEELAKAVIGTGTGVIVVLLNGRPLAIPWLDEHANAILEAWQPGTQTGNAVARVLFGEYNPSGRLAVTFPRTTGQVPMYYNHRNTGKPPTDSAIASHSDVSHYLDVHHSPLYPFGFGLSYTSFAYEKLGVSPKDVERSRALQVQVDVLNRGTRGGTETVQLYVRDLAASSARPVKELKGFQQVWLEPGERRTVEFTLEVAQLGFTHDDGECRVEPGEFQLWVGPSSDEGLETGFTVV